MAIFARDRVGPSTIARGSCVDASTRQSAPYGRAAEFNATDSRHRRNTHALKKNGVLQGKKAAWARGNDVTQRLIAEKPLEMTSLNRRSLYPTIWLRRIVISSDDCEAIRRTYHVEAKSSNEIRRKIR